MKKYGVFDVIGPIMIGPSSSHTAGAARLGKVARAIAGEDIKEVKFFLHGSFAKTYKGHGTDRALVAGILGMEPSDLRLRNSLEIANNLGIKYEFKEADLGERHPNTVKFLINSGADNECEIIGSSIGGGSILITEVNNQEVYFTGEYPTVIISHRDIPGVISKVTAILYDNNINIAFMSVFRTQKGKEATMVFGVDSAIIEEIVETIKKIEAISKVTTINPVKEGI
ncbi:L-serine dehydratase, iron-sulfur-dependent subunit beta [Clostridium polyendosporum]|uniref:L-serine deaminase n=1 Tax=Clostridium polyendosporum TaxID=69208 RepID=A0A919S1G1_9CLOT|nr:L-serine ammonia-lyase, iron-sulfur-dependent subunit beta [Clostridium polyendosporum]GIM29425.1 L-serine dehydratase, iron-sulfur-dependent subunit beta [Clostridium polyendosporum]